MVKAKPPQYVTDAKGRRIGVVLDLTSYERLLAASEDTADVRAYRKAKPKIEAEVSRGQVITLADYKAKRQAR